MAQAELRNDAEPLGRLERVPDHRVSVTQRKGVPEQKRVEAHADAAAALDHEFRIEPVADLPLAHEAVIGRDSALGEGAIEVDVAGRAAEAEEDAACEGRSRRSADHSRQSQRAEL